MTSATLHTGIAQVVVVEAIQLPRIGALVLRIANPVNHGTEAEAESG